MDATLAPRDASASARGWHGNRSSTPSRVRSGTSSLSSARGIRGADTVVLRDGIPGTQLNRSGRVGGSSAREAAQRLVANTPRGRAATDVSAAEASATPAVALDLRPQRQQQDRHQPFGAGFDTPRIPALGSSTSSRSSRQGYQDVGEAEWQHHEREMKKNVAKDRVAFAFYRAPDSSFPSPRLQNLASDIQSQVTTSHQMSTTHTKHQWEGTSHAGLWWGRRRDRMSEYTEAQLIQANIKFRK